MRAWRRERPDVDTEPLQVMSRISRLAGGVGRAARRGVRRARPAGARVRRAECAAPGRRAVRADRGGAERDHPRHLGDDDQPAGPAEPRATSSLGAPTRRTAGLVRVRLTSARPRARRRRVRRAVAAPSASCSPGCRTRSGAGWPTGCASCCLPLEAHCRRRGHPGLSAAATPAVSPGIDTLMLSARLKPGHPPRRRAQPASADALGRGHQRRPGRPDGGAGHRRQWRLLGRGDPRGARRVRHSAGSGTAPRCPASATGWACSPRPRSPPRSPHGYQAQNYALGGVLVVQLLPAIVLGPLAGAFADRFDRRRTMVVTDAVALRAVPDDPAGAPGRQPARDAGLALRRHLPDRVRRACSGRRPRTPRCPTWCAATRSRPPTS